jgi:predicted nucleotidyltransferase
MRRIESTSFSRRLKSGPWPKPVAARLERALGQLTAGVREVDGVVGLILFGSYARAEFGRMSDVDLLVLVAGNAPVEASEPGRRALQLVGRVEADYQLPMHLAPVLVRTGDVQGLGNELLTDIWRDGIVLYGVASHLAALRPSGLAPWALYRFSMAKAPASDRIRLSRRLHGFGKATALVKPPAVTLGRGVLLVPASLSLRVRAAFDEAGATYDAIEVWRST